MACWTERCDSASSARLDAAISSKTSTFSGAANLLGSALPPKREMARYSE